jgi:hypothetical protein
VVSYDITAGGRSFTGSLLASSRHLSMSPAPSTVLPADLSKLNVAQLKAICKERRIVGYSKLGKAALICKLAEVVSSGTPCSTSTQKTASNTQNGSLFFFVRVFDLFPC